MKRTAIVRRRALARCATLGVFGLFGEAALAAVSFERDDAAQLVPPRYAAIVYANNGYWLAREINLAPWASSSRNVERIMCRVGEDCANLDTAHVYVLELGDKPRLQDMANPLEELEITP